MEDGIKCIMRLGLEGVCLFVQYNIPIFDFDRFL